MERKADFYFPELPQQTSVSLWNGFAFSWWVHFLERTLHLGSGAYFLEQLIQTTKNRIIM
jgi:hypothetical protein